ncbi:TonB-dependent receptor plug domain-containing protein [Phenylobacterium kunshanense]|uniref:TonB-dependent receptor n=1 Tax=Phenylobacterium kunshanense TaxID=1445034 RepID=A0A328BCC0_9CAUL|nr:TonB-dependent receptor [Phenylobacterium kunshanense]RAK64315.1 TonB-dependent receptor [Phenylobacterium kunshanense]
MLFAHLLAQAAAAAAPEAAAMPQQGVVSYPPAFFAAQQPQNAHEMVLRLPGFAFDDGDDIRGFEGGGGNVLIDGQRPTSKTDNLDEILRRVPASQVERVDLIRGGAPGIDMQGKSVVANVVRKQSGGIRGLVAVANNHIYDGRNGAGARLELSGRNWEASARTGRGIDDGSGDGPGLRVSPSGSVIQQSQIDSEGDGRDWTLTGAYEQPVLGGKLRVNGRRYHDKFKLEQDQRILRPVPGVESYDGTFLNDETEFGGRFNRAFGAWNLELIGLRKDQEEGERSAFSKAGSDNVFNLERDSSETIARGVLRYRFSDQFSVEGGVEGAINELESRVGVLENGQPVKVPAANVGVEERRGEVFVKSTWRPSPQWTVDGGVRVEGSEISADGDVQLEKTLSFVKPRLLVTWAPTSGTQLRARGERVVGQLDFDDFVASGDFDTGTGVTAGNPDLNPEQAWVGELALEQKLWGGGVIVVTYRHSELSDVIDRGPVPVTNVDPVTGQTTTSFYDQPTNIGSGSKDELIAELTLPFDRIGLKGAQLKGDVTKRWSSVEDPTTGESREISGLKPLEWNATFSHDLPQWRMSYGVDAYGGWRRTFYRFDQVETVKLKTWVRPFAEWRPQPDLFVRFELPNVTSRGLRRIREVYDGPRDTGQLKFTEDRDLQFGRMYYVRIRKTFGA